MKRALPTRLRERGISSRIAQIVLVSPLFILWAGAIGTERMCAIADAYRELTGKAVEDEVKVLMD
jgi:hypothetical protein